jgi:hypothetical protein
MRALIRPNIVTVATSRFRRELAVNALLLGENWSHLESLAVLAASLGGFDLIEDQLTNYRVHGASVIRVAQPTLRNRLRQLQVPRSKGYPAARTK